MPYKLGLKKKYRKWTKHDTRFLEENTDKMSISEIAKPFLTILKT